MSYYLASSKHAKTNDTEHVGESMAVVAVVAVDLQRDWQIDPWDP